ncbi:ubiquitin domain-containing protein 7SL RNA1-like [Primulina huaijiensis]|uniref:ubiquitin domain-containing protein 7SL RNA1-like n=1 Tax=Primulina huaijiensis TaxID=1492673 RepID=UPI003CC71F58
MDLFFVPNRGKPFFIEVGYFDTVLEIKEKVEKYQGIPVARQTLSFNGDVLKDELNVRYSKILDRSRIELLIAPDPNVMNDESLSSSKIHLVLKMPGSKVGITVQMNVTESIRGLKEKIKEIEGIPVSRLVIYANGFELHDRRSLQDCGLADNSELDVLVQASPETTSTGSSVHAVTRPRKLKIFVLTKHGTKRVTLEVNPWEDVGELRPKLQKLEEEMQLDLPKDGYFFIYKQNVMDDDKSFRWHHVGKEDTIEIFSGSVSGGS